MSLTITTNHANRIQSWYKKYKLPKCQKKIYSNKHYIIRLILKTYTDDILTRYPEYCIDKIRKVKRYNDIVHDTENLIRMLPDISNRKPSDIRNFMMKSQFDKEIYNYIGY